MASATWLWTRIFCAEGGTLKHPVDLTDVHLYTVFRTVLNHIDFVATSCKLHESWVFAGRQAIDKQQHLEALAPALPGACRS